MTPEATSRLERRIRDGVGGRDGDTLLARIHRQLPAATERLVRLYGADHDVDALLERLLGTVVEAAAARPAALRALDEEREREPDWFQSERLLGYVCYVDRFAGTLAGLGARLDYLEELGVSYLHLMPLLRPRPGPNDGGYAVADYRAVDPRLGSMDELEELAGSLRARGISLCIDLVVNHTAPEHPWARRALAGDPRFRAFYLLFEDRMLPDAYERSLPEVFPGDAPGNFTWVEALRAWVWTTFHEYQWDLDYRNPDVFAAMLETMLFLAGKGVDVLRLDAVPFLWKELGTGCQNRPEAHLLLQAFRAFASMAAPATIFKAEAIVPPDELTRYLGAHGDAHVPECQIAYNNQLMVLLWSALAERQTSLMTSALRRLRPSPPDTSWATYVRGHDDIGWAIADEDAAAAGLDAFAHRRFLNDFYAGLFPGSFARGASFQENPVTGDARISGTAASLCGVEQALDLGDDELLELALRRLILLYGVAFSWGGLPLVYMGDELALRNDYAFAGDPQRAGDNRWLHRPAMDWAAAGRRHDPPTIEGRVFGELRRLARIRASLPVLHAQAAAEPVPLAAEGVLAYRRADATGRRFLGLANFAEVPRAVGSAVLGAAGLVRARDVLREDGGFETDRHKALLEGTIELPPLAAAWLVEDDVAPDSA